MNKALIATTACAAAVTASALAGPTTIESAKTVIEPAAPGFESARRPMTNPTLFDLAVPRTGIHAIYMHQRMPSKINSQLGKLDLGGYFNVTAIQAEFAITDRFSIVASKDGYINFRPDSDSILSKEASYADLAAGVKYAFVLDPVEQLAVSGTFGIEIPTGSDKVFQGNGDGGINLNVAALKLVDNWQFAGALGTYLPFDNKAEATTGFVSAHVGYNITNKIYALAEMNWYTVLSKGDGSSNFDDSQLNSTVPEYVDFEGGDLINFGAAHAERNIVTAAVGVRYKFSNLADVGFAYELPLTDQENNLMKDRFTVDLVMTF